MKRRCQQCGAHTTIDGVTYCWKCHEKLPTRSSAGLRRDAVARGIGQAAVSLSLLAVVVATVVWALQ